MGGRDQERSSSPSLPPSIHRLLPRHHRSAPPSRPREMSSLVSLFRSSPFLAISGGLYLLAALSLVFHSSSSSRPAFTPSPSSPSHPHHPDVDFETPSDVRTGISSLWPTSQGGKGDVKSKGNLQWKVSRVELTSWREPSHYESC